MSWLSYSVSAWSLGQHVCRFSPAITHLSSFWGFGILQNHPVSLKIYASLLIANSKSVLNIKSRRRSMSLYLKRRPYKVILGGIPAKHSASSLKVFICNFCLPCNASLSWLGTSFFPRVRHWWIRCIAISLISKKLNPIYQIVSEKVSLKKAQNLQRMHELKKFFNCCYFLCSDCKELKLAKTLSINQLL